jgi:hypothetical protein
MNEEITGILEKFPFLTYGVHLETPYLGVIQNCDSQLLSIYVITDIQTEEMRKLFLDLAGEWWWESNRLIPINIFIKERFRPFRECLKHFARKEFVIEAGPAVSLQETIAKRVRKRQITLLQPREE